MVKLIADSMALSNKSVIELKRGALEVSVLSSFLLVLLFLADAVESARLDKGFPFTRLFVLFGLVVVGLSSVSLDSGQVLFLVDSDL